MNSSLEELLHEQLRDLYDAEMQYRYMLPRMIDVSTHAELREMLTETATATSDNLQELTVVCDMLGIQPDGVKCEAMEGLVRETRNTTADKSQTATMDAALIANAQRIAHYEIAGFGTASAFAKCVKHTDAATVLSRLTERAGLRDQRLTRLATGGWFTPGINEEAAATD